MDTASSKPWMNRLYNVHKLLSLNQLDKQTTPNPRLASGWYSREYEDCASQISGHFRAGARSFLAASGHLNIINILSD